MAEAALVQRHISMLINVFKITQHKKLKTKYFVVQSHKTIKLCCISLWINLFLKPILSLFVFL